MEQHPNISDHITLAAARSARTTSDASIMQNITKDEKSCDTCLFYVDSMPDVIICIGGKPR